MWGPGSGVGTGALWSRQSLGPGERTAGSGERVQGAESATAAAWKTAAVLLTPVVVTSKQVVTSVWWIVTSSDDSGNNNRETTEHGVRFVQEEYIHEASVLVTCVVCVRMHLGHHENMYFVL